MAAKLFGMTTAFALAAPILLAGSAVAANLGAACGVGRPCVARPPNCHQQTTRVCGIERGQKVCKVKTSTVCD